MEEYFILLSVRKTPKGLLGDFFGRRNKRKEALLSDLSPLFESYSKGSLLYGWIKENQARVYFEGKKLLYPEAKLIKVDVLSKPATMIIVDE